MKLFSWAQKKLLLTHSSDKHQLHAGGSLDIRRHNYPSNHEQVEVRAKPSSSTHAEVLTIGTLGIGNLLSLKKQEEEEEEEEEEKDEEKDDDDDGGEQVVHYVSPIAERLSPKRESMSSNRDSVSSNRESVSSVDIQKLQEELQKILYFNLGQEGQPPCTATGSRSSVNGGKGKARKQNARRADDCNNVHDSARESHVGSTEKKPVRQLLPLRNFLEMPMDTVTTTRTHNGEAGSPCKLLNKQHYRLLMQSLKSRWLHCSAPTHVSVPTRVCIPAPLFEKLMKPNVKETMPQRGSTMDKALCLLRRVTKRGPNGWRLRNKKANANMDKMHVGIQDTDEEESLNWAISRSYRGSERFICYITNSIAKIDMDDQPKNCQYENGLPLLLKEDGNKEARLLTCPLLGNESWVNTDDEYFVLEL